MKISGKEKQNRIKCTVNDAWRVGQYLWFISAVKFISRCHLHLLSIMQFFHLINITNFQQTTLTFESSFHFYLSHTHLVIYEGKWFCVRRNYYLSKLLTFRLFRSNILAIRNAILNLRFSIRFVLFILLYKHSLM